MTTGEKLSSFGTRHPHVAKFTVKLSMHHGLCGVRRTPPQPKLPPRPRMKLLLAVALSLVTTTAIFAEEKPATKRDLGRNHCCSKTKGKKLHYPVRLAGKEKAERWVPANMEMIRVRG